MTPEKQKLLEELLAGAEDTGIKGTLAAFNPSKPYGKRFEVKGSQNIYVDGEIAFDNFALGQQIQIYKGQGAAQWIFSSDKLLEKSKLKQAQKQARRLASQKKPKNPTVVKGYDPEKGYLVTEGSSEYPNCKSITNGAIAIGATVIRKGKLIDQMRVRPSTPGTPVATPGNKIKYLYTGPTIDGVQCLYAAGWKPNLSIKIREFKDGWVLVSALIDNLGGDRFLCSLITMRQKAANQQEFLCEYYDCSTLQWSIAIPFALSPYGYGFFTGKDQEQVCKVSDGELISIPYETTSADAYEASTKNDFAVQGILTSTGGSGVGDGGGTVQFLYPILTKENISSINFSASSSFAQFPSFLSPSEKAENIFSAQSSTQSNLNGNQVSSAIGFVSYYPSFGYQVGGSQFTEFSANGFSENSFSKIQASESIRWNSQLEIYLAIASESEGSSYQNTESASTSSSLFIASVGGSGGVNQIIYGASGPTITTANNASGESAYLRNQAKSDVADPKFSAQSVRAKTIKESAEIEIISGSSTPEQYFYSSQFPANSSLISLSGSKAECSTKALTSTKDTGSIEEVSTLLSWSYQPVTANTDILKEGIAQIQSAAYTSATITHEYEDAGAKTQTIPKLAKEQIEIIVPFYGSDFLYQRMEKAQVLPPELSTITNEKGAITFTFLNGSYSP
ncbi:hypothetical protein AB3R30_19875 [Leptolyngbyaceae cyanobacterium UHCC 1019]